ncbi:MULTISPECIES: DUF3168 domain-containing protein [unclassified Novosphingobium]|uniref:DUF3168 domain-containing protein n=1 Tax=unclassified Novosphingobium TaxID=2644732 RepID=UPI0013569EBB|nr:MULTISPECIES: DUF3168 domain-containing protein [unclassified Novosphingobium]
MTISPTLIARQTILDAIQADVTVIALIPAAQLYPSKTPNNPVKPFGRYGAESTEPVRASCWRGGAVSGAYHAWVGRTATIPDPKTYCELAMAAIADVLDALPDCYVDRTQMLESTDEPDLWHGLVQFTFTAVEQL